MRNYDPDLLEFRNLVRTADRLAWDWYEERIDAGPVKEAMEAVVEALAAQRMPADLAEEARQHVEEAATSARYRNGSRGASHASHQMAQLRMKLDRLFSVDPELSSAPELRVVEILNGALEPASVSLRAVSRDELRDPLITLRGAQSSASWSGFKCQLDFCFGAAGVPCPEELLPYLFTAGNRVGPLATVVPVPRRPQEKHLAALRWLLDFEAELCDPDVLPPNRNAAFAELAAAGPCVVVVWRSRLARPVSQSVAEEAVLAFSSVLLEEAGGF